MPSNRYLAPSADTRPTLLCFGDSITANGLWFAAPETAGHCRLINVGRAGRTTADIHTELPPVLDAHAEAQGILFLLGLEDLLTGDPRSGGNKISLCLAHLKHGLDLALARFASNSIFLVAPGNVATTSLDYGDLNNRYQITPTLLSQLSTGMEQLARSAGVCFFSLGNLLIPDHFSDGLKPNAAGNALISQSVGTALYGRPGLTASAALPTLYVVGDSISIDYHDALTRACAGSFQYTRKGNLEIARKDLDNPQGANGGDSAAVLEHLREILGKPSDLPSTLAVNCGLHDIKTDPSTGTRQVPLDCYRANLTALTHLVHDSGRRLIWITSTPLDEQRHNFRSDFHRFERDLNAYNAAALEIMRTHAVPVIDLHTFTAALSGPLYRDHVHFLPEVSQRQAVFIRASLKTLSW